MIRLGLNLAFRGGRESLTRLVLVMLGVAVGVCMLAFAIAGFNGLHSQDARWSWLSTGADNSEPSVAAEASDPLYWRFTEDRFSEDPSRETVKFHDDVLTVGRGFGPIERVDVAATGPRSPVPPGIERLPAPGEMYVSPALDELLKAVPRDQLADRFPATVAGTIGPDGLTAPDSLIAVVGRSVSDLERTPGTVVVDSIETAARQRSYTTFFRVILGLGAVGLLFPVLVFIGTTTRLAAARREQRFAAMRLVGATPGQVSAMVAVEAAIASLVGALLGLGAFYLLRPLIARIPFTGERFFTGDLSLGAIALPCIVLGVAAGAIAAALFSLRRVRVSPLGVSRRAVPGPPGAWRLAPLALGLAMLVSMALVVTGETAKTLLIIGGFTLSMVGLVVAGPWLTMAGTRLLANRANRASTMIAARRLSDDPKRAFRSVSGLVMAVFVVSVFTGVVTTAVARSGMTKESGLPRSTVASTFFTESIPGLAPGQSPGLISRVKRVKGVERVVGVYAPPAGLLEESGRSSGADGPYREAHGLVRSDDLEALRALGESPGPGRVVAIPVSAAIAGESLARDRRKPVAMEAGALAALPLEALIVTTDGTPGAVERTRTAVETSLPFDVSRTSTVGELAAENMRSIGLVQRLAFFGIVISLLIAGCSLAVSVAGGLLERKRPFSLLRVTGMSLGSLRRSVMLESAVPLVVVTVLSAALGLLASDLIFRALLHTRANTGSAGAWMGGISPPGLAYYLVLLAGLIAALAMVAMTLPLLRKLTEPENARFE